MAVAHFPFEFGARHQGGDAIDHENIDRVRAHQRVGDFERLLASIGLGNQEFVDIDAEFASIARVERMFGIDEGADAAGFLRLRDHMERQASSCPNFPDRKSQRRALWADRRFPGQYRDREIRSTPPPHRPPLGEPSFMMEPLPNAFSI